MKRAAAPLLLLVAAPCSPSTPKLPSPAWQDQIVYFVMTDRFDDGDASNNDQGAGEYHPESPAHWSGGDLKGIARRLDYIQGLGATAVWLTPPVKNQWWDPLMTHGGYHGYWARDFKAVDEHYGTLDDYRRLAAALHKKGMYLVQDVVVNHMANCFTYPGLYDPRDPSQHVVFNTAAVPPCGPLRPPFSRWRVTDPAERAAGVFHWTPSIQSFGDQAQVYNGQLSDLDDLDTESPVVLQALKDSYAFWIRAVGVDAFRVDTAFYVPRAFFRRWLYDPDGIMAAAGMTGRESFLVFGEGLASDNPYQEVQAQRIQSYMVDPASREPILPSMLDFPMYRTMKEVFGDGRPTAELGYRMDSVAKVHGERRYLMPNFVDNHDTDRFLSSATVPALEQALLFMMTIPGIPVIYQGTEQGFEEQRAAMFKGGFGSGGADHFDTGSELYRYIASIAKLRTDHAVLRRGTPRVVKQVAGGPGAFAFTMTHGGRVALLVFNTADHAVLADNIPTGLPAGSLLKARCLLGGPAPDQATGAAGTLTLSLPARAARVYLLDGTRTAPSDGSIALTVPSDGGLQTGNFTVRGTVAAPGVRTVKVVVDGDLAGARPAEVQDGAFSAEVDVGAMFDPGVVHTVTAYAEALDLASNSGTFRVSHSFKAVVSYADPAGDDHGPGGHYAYPTDPSWGDHHQADLRRVEVLTAGRTLRLELTMAKVTSVWSPQNGFDHVSFSVFLEVPGRGGVTAMPQQSASVPKGMRWSRWARVSGWSNALSSSAGAPQTPTAGIEVDPSRDVVRLTFAPRALGDPPTLSGIKLYLTTWDHAEGGYRTLAVEPQPWAFSGRKTAADPLIMDDTLVLTIP